MSNETHGPQFGGVDEWRAWLDEALCRTDELSIPLGYAKAISAAFAVIASLQKRVEELEASQ